MCSRSVSLFRASLLWFFLRFLFPLYMMVLCVCVDKSFGTYSSHITNINHCSRTIIKIQWLNSWLFISINRLVTSIVVPPSAIEWWVMVMLISSQFRHNKNMNVELIVSNGRFIMTFPTRYDWFSRPNDRNKTLVSSIHSCHISKILPINWVSPGFNAHISKLRCSFHWNLQGTHAVSNLNSECEFQVCVLLFA